MNRIKIELIDITRLEVDAIVNAANNSLLGGGGVDGAIHRAAGKELLAECRLLGGCPTGKAKITKGYNLSAKFVIHTVGPIWNGGNHNEKELLASCYRESLLLAEQYQIRTIAFPAISTGVYRFPATMASEIAIQEVTKFLIDNSSIQQVIFAVIDSSMFDLYTQKLMNYSNNIVPD